MLDDISVESVVEDGGSTGRGRITMLRLAWRREDPLAGVLLLTAEPDHPALPRGRWVVLRDFLRYGLEEPTGDGEVRISPEVEGGSVSIRLARDGRPAWVSVPGDTLRAFLDRTEAILPSGEESSEEVL